MVNYLLKILFLSLGSFFVIFNYYFIYKGHIENFDGYITYFLVVTIFYGIYKYLQILLPGEKTNKITFSPFSILNYFLLHLFVLCIFFFGFNGLNIGGGLVLFFKIIFYSFFPILIIFISTAFGKKILSFTKIGFFNEENKYNKILIFLTSLGIGIFSFIFLLDFIGILGFYNLYVVFGILIIFGIFSYKQILELSNGFLNYKFEFDLKEGKYIRLISTEFLFLVSSLVLSVSLINIVRPFPIGWDDLGVYMNYPHLMAESGSIISLGGMYAWQTFTGIGYMFDSTPQAFFFNVVGGFLSFISIVLITSDLLKSTKKTFINIPLLVGTIFISMPMIIFQQAKDMKLDPGLFFVSIISLYLVYKITSPLTPLLKVEGKNASASSPVRRGLGGCFGLGDKIWAFLIIGLLAGFAFTIKFTSLLLISGIIGIMFFTRLGLSGFLSYLSIYFAIFTKGNLWKYMNVVTNPENIQNFENYFSLISLLLGIGFLIYSFFLNKNKIKTFFIELLIFLLGVFVALIPWIGKNIYDSYPKISVSTIISGKAERFEVDFTKIHTKEEIEKIKEKKRNFRMSASGTTQNEDLGRYFGYEKGINNYIKLPWNLTMQRNQGGEYTDIGFIYLAFIPLIFLFLPFRNKYYSFGIGVFYILGFLFFFSGKFTSIFSTLTLPLGYSVFLLLFIIPTIYFLYTLKNTNRNNLFKLNLIFASFYTFLWAISAFGIVWYGITMYFSFLLMIAIGFYYLSNYDESLTQKEFLYKLFGSLVAFGIVLTYIFNSVFPHSFNNLKNASYTDYKLGKMTIAESNFAYHPEYLKILFELNIKDDKKQDFIINNISGDIIKGAFIQNNIGSNISLAVDILKQYESDEKIHIQIRNDAQQSLQNIYSGILNPSEEYKNKDGIYRIGTFLKYHISENNKRLLEDSLIFNFNDYIHTKDADKTIENLEKLGVNYLLVDLNAATIDRDARHNLTNRYEKLLSTFVSDKLKLVETDSMCLKVGLEDYSKNKDIEKYMTLAGINYESYKDGKTIARGEKAMKCYEYIIDLMENNKISETNYNYLIGINNYINNNKKELNTKEKVLKFLHTYLGNSYKVLFKIK